MNSKEFFKLCNISRKIYKKNSNFIRVSISQFNIMKSHSYYLDRYQHEGIKVFYIFNKILKYFMNLTFCDQNYQLNSENLIISNLVSPKKVENKDAYFSHLIKIFNKKKIKYNILYRNVSQSNIQFRKKNIFLTSTKRNIFIDIYFFFKILFELYFLYLSLIFSKKNHSEKHFIRKSLGLKNIFSSLSNIIEVNKILNFVKSKKPKKIFFTFEGYAWEKILCYKIRQIDKNISIYGYYFSIISKYQFFPFEKINNNFLPDKILTSGDVSKKKFINHGFKKNDIVNIGSNNYVYQVKKNNKSKTCLVLPEFSKTEINFILNFIKSVLKKDMKFKFILRLHPGSDKKNFRNDINNSIIGYNIKLSQNRDIYSDFKKCNYALYRSSGSIIHATRSGLYPIYLKKLEELTIDPLYELNDNKICVEKPENFEKIINDIDKIKNKNKIKKITSYCYNYYSKPNLKNIIKLVND